MDISDYFTKVKNLTNALTSIGAPIDDEDLVVMTLNGLAIVVRKTFLDF
jgi:hypothetical protein